MSWKKKKAVTISGFCLNAHICLIELLKVNFVNIYPLDLVLFVHFYGPRLLLGSLKTHEKKKEKRKRAAVNIQPF